MITVVTDNNPTITANNISIKLGDSFDPLNSNNNLVAINPEDGDITTEIVVASTNVDQNRPGVYQVTYSAKDSDGNITFKEIEVIVRTDNAPTLEANNVIIKEGDSFDTMNAGNNLVATDLEDGDLTQDITVISDNVDANTPGNYQVVYQVIDSDGNTVTKNITVIVRTNQAPTINANDVSIKEGEEFDPLSLDIGLTALDLEEGNLIDEIKIVSNNVNNQLIGLYQVIYSVEDYDGNIGYKEITVKVLSDVSLTIEANNISIELGDEFNPLNANNDLISSDQEDGDITSDINVLNNNVDVNTPGIYQVKYSVIDSDDNISYKEIIVTVEPDKSNENNEIIVKNKNIILKEGQKNDASKPKRLKVENQDGQNITKELTLIYNNINLNQNGQYQLFYEDPTTGEQINQDVIVKEAISLDLKSILGIFILSLSGFLLIRKKE